MPINTVYGSPNTETFPNHSGKVNWCGLSVIPNIRIKRSTIQGQDSKGLYLSEMTFCIQDIHVHHCRFMVHFDRLKLCPRICRFPWLYFSDNLPPNYRLLKSHYLQLNKFFSLLPMLLRLVIPPPAQHNRLPTILTLKHGTDSYGEEKVNIATGTLVAIAYRNLWLAYCMINL